MAIVVSVGKKFGRLTVVSKNPERSKYRYVRWDCICECGERITVISSYLTTGDTRSCGCYRSDSMRESATTHGRSNSTEYSTWNNMIQRCTNPENEHYHNYGGRGITVCKRWEFSFELFLSDMGDKPGREYSIERRKNDEGYYPENCYWATRSDQNNNRRSNVTFTYKGQTMTLSQWAHEYRISYDKLHSRVMQLGWEFEKAITTP